MDKAVVLAAGLGSRMRERDPTARLAVPQEAAASSGEKAMMPILGHRFLDYVLSSLADAAITDVCLVVRPEASEIRDRYAHSRRFSVTFAVQSSPEGTADALLAAEEFAGKAEFLALNSDNLYPASALRGLRSLGEPGLPVFERRGLVEGGNIPFNRIARYAVLDIGADGYLKRIVEKPNRQLPDESGEVLISMNVWRFGPSIFDACRRVGVSARGERELPQAVGLAIAEKTGTFRTFPCRDPVLDLSARADIAAVEERVKRTGVEI